MANTQPNTLPNPAESPNSENNDGVPVEVTDAGGVTTPTNIEDLPDEVQAEINRRLKQARLDGEESGKKKAKKDAESKRNTERRTKLESEQDFESLYNEEKASREEAEERANAAERNVLALEIALEKKLPNPHLAYKRLIGSTREELEEDAKSLLKVLKSDTAPTEPKTTPAPEDPNPPATSEGGNDPTTVTKTVEEQNSHYAAQRASSTYNF